MTAERGGRNVSANPSPAGSARVGLSLWTLFLGAFVVGSAELVVVGILDLIAGDLQVSISSAGTLVTAYALGISIGGPALTAVSMKVGRRTLLRLSLAAYVAGNVLAGLAVNFGILLLARVLTGALHGLFIGVAFAVAASMVPPERMGRSISMVFGGISVATALGVPLGTLLGQEVSWHATFLAIAGFGLVALVATLVLVPRVPNAGGGGFGAQARHALAPRVLAVLGLGFFIMGGQFAALTYLTPFLAEVTHISGGAISLFLLAYGIANAVGTFAGGWAADRGASRTLVIANVVLVVAIGGLYFGGAGPVLVAVALLVWGVVGFGLVPSLQYRVISLAGPGRDLAATLPPSAVTAGIAAGAAVGGWALSAHGPSAAVLTGLIITAVALPFSWLTGFLRPPTPAAAPEPETTAAEPAGN
jgi:DHA1 family inner membrane transport protein